MLEKKQYVLTVEGETEQWYFLWLRDKINKVETRKFNMAITIKVQQSPRSYYKGVIAKSVPEVIHICDIESADAYDIKKFEDILKQMKEAKKHKNIKYELGYNNFTFELWMILHKRDCFRLFDDRKQYLVPIQQCFKEKFDNLECYKQEAAFKRCLDKLTLEDVKAAIKRADTLMQNNVRNGKKLTKYSGYSYYRENPSLSIHEVVKRMLSECGVMS